MWLKKQVVLGILDSHLATMMEAGLRTKWTMQKTDRKDGRRSQVLGHIIASSSYLEFSTTSELFCCISQKLTFNVKTAAEKFPADTIEGR